ncbi:MAG: NAD-glutamate dehydrogenase [Rubrobacter sp.]|nr:NAD-glutamate dehydrogenase [Rubrobacter sp.]
MVLKDEVLDRVVERVRKHLPAEKAPQVEEFVNQYYGWVAPADLAERSPVDIYGAAVAHWNFIQKREPGTEKVFIYNPNHDDHGWQSTHTVVEIANDDMPFLVDSVGMAISGLGHGIHLMFHPIIKVRRDGEGNLLELLPPDSEDEDAVSESVMHVEIDQRTEPKVLEELRESLARTLHEVRAAVEDWREMRARVGEIVSNLEENPPSPVDEKEIEETVSFLRWLEDNHFTFTGYREYALDKEGGEDILKTVPSSGLGILRESGNEAPISRSFAELPPEVRRLAREPHLLNLTKANSKSRVHRPAYLDYVGVKTFDGDGNVVGERRFLGLYTSSAYSMKPTEIPLVEGKIRNIMERSGFPPSSHYEKALVEILESYPRDQLLQTPEDELYKIAMGILQLQERQQVRLFVRRDTYGRFLSCLVYVPRDHYDTEARRRIHDVLIKEFDGESEDFSVRLSESVLARLHFIIYTDPSKAKEYDVAEIEAKISDATRTWTDNLRHVLIEGCGEDDGTTLFHRYRDAFPAGYKDEYLARRAVPDIRCLEGLDTEEDIGMSLYHQLEEPQNFLRFKMFRMNRIVSLSEALPLLENMGVRVADELGPYEVRAGGNELFWIHDFGLEAERELQTSQVKDIFQDTFQRVWHGQIENDGFNRLVLKAGLDWREISMLRACCKYLRQTNLTFSQNYMERTLDSNPGIAAMLVELFTARFDPRRQRNAEEETERIVAEIEEALDSVTSLDEDRIIHSFMNVILATTRTNFYQKYEDGESKEYISFKLEPGKIPELPLPKPMFEIFVYSPRMEGVHLRGGEVARGGIRWSDRREDFRTEVLGLMKAQMVKNAVIVPVGAKGGFVVKNLPMNGDREAVQNEVVHCYKTLIRGMLDITDNLVENENVHPENVVRYDDDDSYLVVAADKGTATFSDIANGLSKEYGFWLGDAFASGGSVGYDHKAMGITAKGAWESVKRHFRELGLDTQSEDFTTIGVGDMNGDVFGNGMLLSRHIKLVGAFNHMHIFLDPNPDPEKSHEERQRLFELPRSTWNDYDQSLISEGGGVFSRSAKSIELTPEVKELLDIDADRLTPNEVINAMLKARVDLLWNGGIGTYVKSSEETNAEVGDRTNDSLRVDGSELRCRVFGEGGNLGLTQRGRIEYVLNDGRIYMDAIDNSAGVDCSDHEVNIKVLLDATVESGDMTDKQRNELLAEMTEEVGELVLRDNYLQTQALSNAIAQSASMADVHARYISSMESSGALNREIEFLPGDEELADRKAAGFGLTAPEFSVLLAYTKISLYQELLGSEALEDDYLAREMEHYFPTPLRERFSDRMKGHRLRREIVATVVVNSLVNRCGITFAYRLGEEAGAEADDIVRAYAASREIFGLRSLWKEIESLDNEVPAEIQTEMILDSRKLIERSTRWLLRNRRPPLDIGAIVSRFSEGADELCGRILDFMLESEREKLDEEKNSLEEKGVPEDLARRAATLGSMFSILDIVDTADKTGQSIETAASVYFTLGDRMNLHLLRDHIDRLPRDNRWRTLARAALRDDLYGQQATLTAEILRSVPADGKDAGERIEAWVEANQRAVDRTIQVLRDINQSGVYDLSTLPVMLREIRNLIASSEAREEIEAG